MWIRKPEQSKFLSFKGGGVRKINFNPKDNLQPNRKQPNSRTNHKPIFQVTKMYKLEHSIFFTFLGKKPVLMPLYPKDPYSYPCRT